MAKKCIKIVITSGSGYFARIQCEDRLVLTRETIRYCLKFDKKSPHYHMFEERIKIAEEVGDVEEAEHLKNYLGNCKDKKWSHKFDVREELDVEKIFGLANVFEFNLEHCPVLDGAGLGIVLFFDDKTKKEFFTTYGDCVDEFYGDMHKLLQLISPLVPDGKYKPDYFAGKEPECVEDEED